MGNWGDFQGLNEATGGGRGSKNLKIGATSFMDGPLKICHKLSVLERNVGNNDNTFN